KFHSLALADRSNISNFYLFIERYRDMKKFLVLAIALLASCSKSEAPKVAIQAPIVQTATINIPTSKCSECAATITGALKKVQGVQKVEVDPEAHKAVVQYASIDLHAIETAIAKAGYTANNVPRDSMAYEALADCCK